MQKKEILVPNGDRKKLMKLFNTTYPTVRTALRGTTKTALAERIRIAALERGGVIATIDLSNKQ